MPCGRFEQECALTLSFQQRESDGVSVLELSGRIVLGEECDGLRELVKQLLAEKRKRLLFNLADVARVDSSGIGVLVEAVVLTAKAGGRLKLAKVPRLLHNSLVIHRLLQAFDIYETEEEALVAFQQEG